MDNTTLMADTTFKTQRYAMDNQTYPTETTVGKMNISSDTPTLEAMNKAEVEKLIPTIVFLLIVGVVGLVGNALVIHVYRTRFKMSNSKCFILCLSAVDLLTCCIAIPLEVSTIVHQYTFEHLWLCKTSRVFNTLGTISSSFILLFIAVDRFRKVCKPFGWQIKTSVAKFLCALALFFGIMVSWPAIFVYGKHTFDIPEFNMTGTECSTADEMVNTKFPFFYAIGFGFMFVAGIISMSILYCFIGHKVRKHSQKMSNAFGRSMSIPMTSSIIESPRDSKLAGQIDTNVAAKYELANDTDNKLPKRRSTKKKKKESEDSWTTDKKDFELSYTFTQEGKEKEKSMENINNLDKEFHEKKDNNDSDSEDSGIKVKEETENDDKKREELNNGKIAVRYKKTSEVVFEEQEVGDIKSEVSPTSSEEILPKKKKSVFRRMSSISSRVLSNVILRMTSITSARSNSDASNVKRTQFLKQARARKTAFLMFVVTLAFILSFLPHLLLMLIRQIKSDFVDDLSETGKAVYKFFLRSYFLNSAINPVIYSICDSRFKSACKEIFGHCFGASKTHDIKG